MEDDLLNTSSPILPKSIHQSLGGGAGVKVAQVWVNRVLGVAHDIALGGDYKLFFKVVSSLWLVSFVGNVFNFLTLVYMGEFWYQICSADDAVMLIYYCQEDKARGSQVRE
ncbi:hypothetical protein GIB67_026525 [Kingdonia uniflora]|uniref:Reticulon-like protein n=1 Tax=Kingdonia uniflora TaxID=39325 RepID=A0A7J7PCC3_9MAGN|nr:hypothetical protein GIB67_026525 [Kingdonia uniflora]